MSDANTRIAELARRFVDELQVIARDELMQMLGGAGGGRRSKRTTNGVGGRGAKRSPEDLDALAEKFMMFVKAHPGKRIEECHRELGTSTKDLALPIKKLIAEKVIRTTGSRRATRYFAAGSGGAGKKKAKRAKKK